MTKPTMEGVIDAARKSKEEVVAEHGDDPDDQRSDLHGYCVAVRRDRPVAMVFIGDGEDATRECLFWTCATMRCSEVWLVADTRYRKYEPSDIDEVNRNTRQGDYQRDWHAGNRAGIAEAIMITRYPMLGDPNFTILPYERAGRLIEWGEPMLDVKMNGGALPKYAAQGWLNAREVMPRIQAILDQAAAHMGVGLDDQELHEDRATAQYLLSQGIEKVVLMTPEATEVYVALPTP